jgi:hypothetical protein
VRLTTAILCLAFCRPLLCEPPPALAQRLVILKVDGLNADLLFDAMRHVDRETGRSRLPWLTHIFAENGVIFDNFYTRGISLSAPSWSLLDTGKHLVIKGNVEYDRYTGRVYDYLNFFPFYLGYARSKQVDMPSVEVLDEAGIPMLIDSFPVAAQYQSFQLFQRGVRWKTLRSGLVRRFSTRVLLSLLEDPQGGLGLGEGLAKQTEYELMRALQNPNIKYLDLFTGEIDHVAHSLNRVETIEIELRQVDALAGRIWAAIQASPLASKTLFVVVSDHGMNNVPNVYSQTFSLPDLLNSSEGGAHHVVTNRHQLSDYKIAGLDPLVSRVINPSSASFYLKGQSEEYATAWLDLDGNERAAVCLRNSDVNRMHILLQQLSRRDIAPALRAAATRYFEVLIDRHRAGWMKLCSEMKEELKALNDAIEARRAELSEAPKKWSSEDREEGLDRSTRRKASELDDWIDEHRRYSEYIRRLEALTALRLDVANVPQIKITDLISTYSLGDANTIYELQHYVVGPGPDGLVIDDAGKLDEERSFRYVNYFPLLTSQRVRNNPQPAISPRPIDFVAASLPAPAAAKEAGESAISEAVWLYGDDDHELVELVRSGTSGMEIRLIPVTRLHDNTSGTLSWHETSWASGFPLSLYEDGQLNIPQSSDRTHWLSSWHTEREWMDAVHRTKYSNGVIGITEELLPPSRALAGSTNSTPALARLEERRRELVQADFHVFAADHWNFNVRNFNPGGNHGSFLRISTHSVWMMAGPEIPRGKRIQAPYDSLNFASTLLDELGRPAPMADRIVHLLSSSPE